MTTKKQNPRLPWLEGWAVALPEQREPAGPPYSRVDTYVNIEKIGLLLVHYQYPQADGYWKAIDSKSGQDARGETAEEALARLSGWMLTKKSCADTIDGKVSERTYCHDHVTLKVEESESGMRYWTATDESEAEATDFSAGAALRLLAQMHQERADWALTLGKTVAF